MSKRRFNFGLNYLDNYIDKVWIVSKHPFFGAQMAIRKNRYRDAQQWAYRGEAQK